MKKILILIAFVFSFVCSFGQSTLPFPLVQSIGNDSALLNGHNLYLNGAVYKLYTDTTAANATHFGYYNGSNGSSIIFTSSGGLTEWYRYAGGWHILGGSAAMNFWSLTGNTGTNPAINFLGTTDNNNLIFKRRNIQSGLLDTTNSSWGVGALNPNATGTFNTALGGNSLQVNTSGSFNTAIGVNAILHDTSGFENSSIGVNTLENTTSGSGNTAIGFMAGQVNVTGNNNTLVGTNSNVLSSGLMNATAIGASSLVGCSNCEVIGDSAHPHLGLGTAFPDSTLTVHGGVEIRNGTQGAGKVLTSDTNGGATWQTLSAGSVSSVAAGYGTNFPTITTTGSVIVDSTVIMPKKDSGYIYITPFILNSKGYGNGTVTNLHDSTTNGVAITWVNRTTTPAPVVVLGNITPTSVQTNSINLLRQYSATLPPAHGNTLFDSTGIGWRDSTGRTVFLTKGAVTPGTIVTDAFPNASGTIALTSNIPSQFNPIAGTNVTLSGTYPNVTFNSTGSGSGSLPPIGYNIDTGNHKLNANDTSFIVPVGLDTTNSQAAARANTIIINNAIDTAVLYHKNIKIPGTYYVHTIILKTYFLPNVNGSSLVGLVGINKNVSQLLSDSAVPMLFHDPGGANLSYRGIISDITFNGENIGTNGWEMYGMSNCTWTNVSIDNFQNKDIYCERCLENTFNGLNHFGASDTAVDFFGSGGNMANGNVFNNCIVQGARNIGYFFYDGSLNVINSGDMESIGTSATKANAYAIRCSKNSEGQNNYLAISVNNTWFEQDTLHALFFGDSAFDDEQFKFDGINAKVGNSIDHAMINKTYGGDSSTLSVYNSKFVCPSDSTAFIADGVGAQNNFYSTAFQSALAINGAWIGDYNRALSNPRFVGDTLEFNDLGNGSIEKQVLPPPPGSFWRQDGSNTGSGNIIGQSDNNGFQLQTNNIPFILFDASQHMLVGATTKFYNPSIFEVGSYTTTGKSDIFSTTSFTDQYEFTGTGGGEDLAQTIFHNDAEGGNIIGSIPLSGLKEFTGGINGGAVYLESPNIAIGSPTNGNYGLLQQVHGTYFGDQATFTTSSLITNAYNGIKVKGNTQTDNFFTTSATPSISAGAGAGTSPTVSISGTNEDGVVTVTTGTLPTLGATAATITFSSSYAFPNDCAPTLTPANAATALLSGATMVYTTGSTATWTITAGATALSSSTTYVWNYHIGGF